MRIGHIEHKCITCFWLSISVLNFLWFALDVNGDNVNINPDKSILDFCCGILQMCAKEKLAVEF